MERLAQVAHKFKYPLFETFHWYAAKTFYDELRGNIQLSHLFLYYFSLNRM